MEYYNLMALIMDELESYLLSNAHPNVRERYERIDSKWVRAPNGSAWYLADKGKGVEAHRLHPWEYWRRVYQQVKGGTK